VAARRPSLWGGAEQWPRSRNGGHWAGQSLPLTAVHCASVAPGVTGVMTRGCPAAPCTADGARSSTARAGGDAIRPGGGEDAGGCGGRPLSSGREANDGAARAVSADDGATHGGARGNGAGGDGASLGGDCGDGASLGGAGGDGATHGGARGNSAGGDGASLGGAGGDDAATGRLRPYEQRLHVDRTTDEQTLADDGRRDDTWERCIGSAQD